MLEIGAKSAVSLFGENISKVFSSAVSLGLLSVLSAMIMTGPRIYYAMSRDRKIPIEPIGYPITPLVFILGNLWIIIFSIKSRPVTALFGRPTIGLGTILYIFFARTERTNKSALGKAIRWDLNE